VASAVPLQISTGEDARTSIAGCVEQRFGAALIGHLRRSLAREVLTLS
jgi:hypothetical protein